MLQVAEVGTLMQLVEETTGVAKSEIGEMTGEGAALVIATEIVMVAGTGEMIVTETATGTAGIDLEPVTEMIVIVTATERGIGGMTGIGIGTEIAIEEMTVTGTGIAIEDVQHPWQMSSGQTVGSLLRTWAQAGLLMLAQPHRLPLMTHLQCHQATRLEAVDASRSGVMSWMVFQIGCEISSRPPSRHQNRR